MFISYALMCACRMLIKVYLLACLLTYLLDASTTDNASNTEVPVESRLRMELNLQMGQLVDQIATGVLVRINRTP